MIFTLDSLDTGAPINLAVNAAGSCATDHIWTDTVFEFDGNDLFGPSVEVPLGRPAEDR